MAADEDELAYVKYTVNQIGCVTFAHPCIQLGHQFLSQTVSLPNFFMEFVFWDETVKKTQP